MLKECCQNEENRWIKSGKSYCGICGTPFVDALHSKTRCENCGESVEFVYTKDSFFTCPKCNYKVSVLSDSVNHPQHYGGDTTYETIKVIEAWNLGFNLGNVIKYISRANYKGQLVEDLKKAKFYLEREIARLESN